MNGCKFGQKGVHRTRYPVQFLASISHIYIGVFCCGDHPSLFWSSVHSFTISSDSYFLKQLHSLIATWLCRNWQSELSQVSRNLQQSKIICDVARVQSYMNGCKFGQKGVRRTRYPVQFLAISHIYIGVFPLSIPSLK
jgi:hypothetical protein